ncbi:unnamed protein product, partial [Oppiella nova]
MQNKNLSEDCLYLNIWAPTATIMRSGVTGRKASKQRSTTSGRKTSRVSKRQSVGLKPVMFYAHGGGFTMGSSNELRYRGEALATYGDVIVVNFNYRLNTLGFLYTGTDDGPGNVGLWDHALALEWVHKNIKNF